MRYDGNAKHTLEALTYMGRAAANAAPTDLYPKPEREWDVVAGMWVPASVAASYSERWTNA